MAPSSSAVTTSNDEAPRPENGSGASSIKKVLNFYVSAKVDGRANPVAGGPREAEGGFVQEVFIRAHGEPRKALTLVGTVEGNELVLRVLDDEGELCEIRSPK